MEIVTKNRLLLCSLLVFLVGSFYVAVYYHPLRLKFFQQTHYDPYDSKAKLRHYGRAENATDVSFLIVGDWGMDSQMQRRIAEKMAIHAERAKCQFVLNAGDNIYSFGSKTPYDPQFRQFFEDPFFVNSEFAQLPWYSALGNHDKRGNWASQVEYSKISPRWAMKNNYYSFSLEIFDNLKQYGEAAEVKFMVLDTTVLVCPDSAKATVEQAVEDVECEILIYSELASQFAAKNNGYLFTNDFQQLLDLNTVDRRAQLQWVNDTLASWDKIEREKGYKGWKFVLGHHAMESASFVHGPRPQLNQDLRPLLNQYGAHVYMCGHDHNLQLIKSSDPIYHIVSGGGGFVTSPFSLHKTDFGYPGLMYGSSTFGFVVAHLKQTQLFLEFVDYRGDIVSSFTINKE